MDELIRNLDRLTGEMMDRLQDATYEELEDFVEERQNLVDSITQEVEFCPATQAQKQGINLILSHDNELLDRMNALRQEAQDFLQKRGQAKIQRNAYETAYTPDSFLMDRKK
ncbi:flagellar protein FliT [Paenibacillus silagei]|uniref:Flagellar protein FliT n=1 Tax=Paenibacillus silagei TaxID=1670801 RepID=A0ABS4NIU7_9BACL|nr:flagellar protein FliT [Paenibacillus silagei]MBP2109953.1 SAM-dependent MidA family methyltransferase [Paenibacillus silagei]